MAKSQALFLDAVGPLTFLQEELEKGTLTPQTTREAAQMALRLLGNASCHISADWRKNVLGDLNPRLTDMADEDKQYREAPPNLFGDGFAKKAKERDEELKALQKATSHSRPYQKTDSRAPQAGKDRFFSKEPPFHIHQEGRQLQRLFPRQETAQKPPIPAERKRAREETKQQSVTKRLKTVTNIDTVHKVVLPVIAHVFPSLPLVLPILSKEKFLKNIAESTIVKQLNVLEIQDIAHRNACQNLPLAGRISHFIYNWEVITKDA